MTAATDLFFDGTTLTELPGERHPDGAAHGSGCTHSSTLAARLALGDEPLAAARHARAVAARAVADGLRDIGAGRRAGRRLRPCSPGLRPRPRGLTPSASRTDAAALRAAARPWGRVLRAIVAHRWRASHPAATVRAPGPRSGVVRFVIIARG